MSGGFDKFSRSAKFVNKSALDFMKKRLLLISNSKTYKEGYLDHVADEIVGFLKGIKRILFVPYALRDRNAYTTTAYNRFKKMGIELESIHKAKNPQEAIERTSAIFIGGGNTFRLLNEMYKTKIIEAVKNKVKKGMPYIGTSAGANVACPTIKTTNDMPIVYPPNFDALNLVPFQINPHYIEVNTNSKHMGETREQRIKEFHEENLETVVGLKEGSWLRIENNNILLSGEAKIFIKGKNPVEYKSGNALDFLLNN